LERFAGHAHLKADYKRLTRASFSPVLVQLFTFKNNSKCKPVEEKKIESNLHNCRALPICLFSSRLALGEKTKQEREGK
jgi:hypothetical protein